MNNSDAPRRPGRPSAEEIGEGERRGQILRVAAEHFGRRGYAGVSLGEIAREVGITKAALYHHFSSKQDLYTAAMTQLMDRIEASIRDVATSSRPVDEKIRQLVSLAILHVPAEASLEEILRDSQEHLTATHQTRMATAHDRMLDAWEVLAREGIRTGEFRDFEPRLLAYCFQQTLHAFSGRRGQEAGFGQRPAVVEQVVEFFLHGARGA